MKKYLYILFFLFYYLFSSNLYSDCIKPEMPSDQIWQEWLLKISNEAAKNGINQEIINQEISHLQPLEKIILRDRCQPESTITFQEYIYYRLDKTRIYVGKKKYNEFKDKLKIISQKFNIQQQFILAIWGMESYYGSNQGSSKIIPALTTLSFDHRRSEFYKKQLLASLKMIQENLVSSNELVGSWAGAMGQVQFLPTTYLESAFDFDNDGKKDIWNNELDVFASIANYLTSIDKVPWNINSSWGMEVIPPDNIKNFYDSLKKKNPKGCYAVKSMSIEKNLSEWAKLGFKQLDNSSLSENNLKARLVVPDGLNGRMFLVYPNYKNILYYNCSHYYALTVGLLSDNIISYN